MSYGGPGRPRFLIVNSSGFQGPHKGHGVQTAQAIKMVLADRGWRAGPYTIGMQACEETSARTGQPSTEKCRRNARAFAMDRSVLGVVGPLYSSCAANMLATLNRAPGGPLAVISGSNTYVGLTRARPGAAPGEPRRYFPTGQRSYARMAPTDDIQGAADALVAGRLGMRRAFVLDDRSAYGTALAGTFRGLYVQGEDIAQSDPNINHVHAALRAMDLVVVQDLFLNETARFAHVFLPGTSFLEKDGTFTNAERRINRVRPVFASKVGMDEWEITCAIGRAMGYNMSYASASEIMDEVAATTPTFAGVSFARLDEVGSMQWPVYDTSST